MIKIRSRSERAVLCAAAIAVLLGIWVSAKWNFANTLSTRAELKEIADLAAALAPSDPQTRFAAAAVYGRTFEPEDQIRSLAEYERVAALSPNNFLCWLELGRARERTGDTAGAELALKRALDLAPNYAEVNWAYGNALLRAGKLDEGFRYISLAAESNAIFTGPSVVTAMEILGGDIGTVQQRLPETPSVRAALAVYLARQKRFDDAAAVWGRISAEIQRSVSKEQGVQIAAMFLAANRFRLAAGVSADLSDAQAGKTETGKIFDGGFEFGVKLRGAGSFEWQIAEGTQPQIAISRTQKHGGESSLLIAFNTTQASEFRTVSQTVAVEPAATYEMEFYYRSELKTGFTVRWEIANANDNAAIASSEPVLANSGWATIRTKFTVPAASDGVIIRLVRNRCPSTVCQMNGSLWLDDVSIKKL